MNKYRVTIPYAVYVTTEVEAEDEENAIELACENNLRCYVGNNALDRLCGITEGSLEPSEEPIEMDPFQIKCEEVSEDA